LSKITGDFNEDYFLERSMKIAIITPAIETTTTNATKEEVITNKYSKQI